MLLGKSREKLLIVPEKKKIELPGQSENNTELWMCLVAKVKPNDVKNNTVKLCVVFHMLYNRPLLV